MSQITATGDMMQPSPRTERGVQSYDLKLGMWVFLASEVMFFTGLIGSYIVLRFGAPGAWALPGVVLNVPLTAFNTFLLICSSVSMVKAYAAIADGDQKGLRMWFALTILGGAMFVGVQVYEYVHLVGDGFVPSGIREGSDLAEKVAAGAIPAATSGLYGSTFYIMTGFHGFHVSAGVVSMLYLFIKKVLPGKYTKQDYRGVEVVGLYWHFVDLVWIILFTIVYLV